jgi:hypothetical protein
MHAWLKDAPDVIKEIFDILDLLIFRLTLLALATIGAFAVIRRHLH